MIIKTNIKDFINDNYIDSVDKFKYEINKGLCAKFNGRESFYGYYDCINKIIKYINNELSLYDVFSIKGYKLEKAKVIIEGYDILINISGVEFYVGLIVQSENKVSTFDKFGVYKSSYKKDEKIIYELFFHHETEGVEEFWPIGSFICCDYSEYLKTEHWNNIKATKKHEAGYRCQLCSNDNKLHVHHNNYNNLFMEEMNDLIVLCKDCHSKFHDKI